MLNLLCLCIKVKKVKQCPDYFKRQQQDSTCLRWYVRAKWANWSAGALLGGLNGSSKFKIDPQIGVGVVWNCFCGNWDDLEMKKSTIQIRLWGYEGYNNSYLTITGLINNIRPILSCRKNLCTLLSEHLKTVHRVRHINIKRVHLVSNLMLNLAVFWLKLVCEEKVNPVCVLGLYVHVCTSEFCMGLAHYSGKKMLAVRW